MPVRKPKENREGAPIDFDDIRNHDSGEVRHPNARTLGDWIGDRDDVDLTKTFAETNDSPLEKSEEAEPVSIERKPIGTLGRRIERMRKIAKKNKVTIEEPDFVSEVKKDLAKMDLVSRFKRKLANDARD